MKFIEKIWPQLNECQRDFICQYQKLSIDFVIKIWDELTIQQRYIIQNQDPLTKFVTYSLEERK
ncbi:MAG: hypothetical protein QXP60_05750 [Nitrososphaerota archaeon]